jgi:hypothetical protein
MPGVYSATHFTGLWLTHVVALLYAIAEHGVSLEPPRRLTHEGLVSPDELLYVRCFA